MTGKTALIIGITGQDGAYLAAQSLANLCRERASGRLIYEAAE